MGEYAARKLLAENLRVLRLLRGWSQEELAATAGLDRSYVGGIERAQRNVSLDNLERLARAFEVPITDLLLPPDAQAVGARLLAHIRRTVEEGEPLKSNHPKGV